MRRSGWTLCRDRAGLTPRRVLCLAGAWLAASSLPGCASSPKPVAPAADAAATLYQTGRYQEAFSRASQEATSLRSTDRAQASLIAGLSAQALSRPQEAEKWLAPLLGSKDAALSGKAAAALGLIAKERREHSKAVELLTWAQDSLSGSDSARAAMYAGDSLRLLGKDADARARYDLALSRVGSDQTLRVLIADRFAGGMRATALPTPPPRTVVLSQPVPAAGRYCVQAGAFSTLGKAQQVAQGLRSLGPVTITPLSRSGSTLYVVRAGSFETPSQASSAASRVGGGARVATAGAF